jgi:hypothetical protein
MTEANKKPEIAESIHSNEVAENQDAQLTAEGIETGVQDVADVNVGDDYAASKQYSENPHLGTKAGEQEIAAATAHQFEIPQPDETMHQVEPTGNPDDFREMAKEMSSTSSEGGNVTDDLLQKALEKGQPTQQS